MGAQPFLDQVFVLRFWREEADASDQGRWRVLIRNINTRQRDVVDDVQRAFAIVAGSLNAAVPDASPERSARKLTDSLCREPSPVEDSDE
jgi:hypothetical protein